MRNFKRILAVLLVAGLLAGLNEGLMYLLYPYTYTRADMHHIITDEYEVLLVGSSHGKCGLDPQVMAEVTGRKTLNVCQGGQYPVDSCHLVMEAARHQNIKRVIYELDPGYWVTEPNQSADYVTFYQEMPWSTVKLSYFADKMMKADFRTVLFPWYFYRNQIKRIPEFVHQKQSDVYKNYGIEPFASEVQTYREDGFIARHPLPSDRQQEDVPHLWQFSEPEKDSVEGFEKMVRFCKKEGIQLIVVTTPIPKATYEKYKSHYEAAEQYFTDYLEKLQVPYYCYLNTQESDIPQDLEEFADYDGHMYEEAAGRFSRIFAENMK